MLSRYRTCSVQFLCKLFIKYLVDQRTLSRSRYARNACHDSERYLNINVFKIVLCCPFDFKPSVWLSSDIRDRYALFSGKILSRYRFGDIHYILGSTCRHNLSAVASGSRSYINYPVRSIHGILIMLDNDQCIAKIPQMLERCKQLVVIPLMKADAWFVEYIADTHQSRTYLCRQPDTLCFSSRKRCCRS